MKQYLDVLNKILKNGRRKGGARENMPETIGISHAVIQMNMKDGYPLLTTKKMYFRGIVEELLWMLRGETNIKTLINKNVNIWNGDAYRWYLKTCNDNDIEIFFTEIKHFVDFINSYDNDIVFYENSQLEFHIESLKNIKYIVGDLGKVYGHQWRNQNGVDQISKIIDDLKSRPYERYKILDGWNISDFNESALMPCHLLYQFICSPLTFEERFDYAITNGYDEFDLDIGLGNTSDVDIYLDELNVPKYLLDLNMYQRSVDSAAGMPFNLASMSLFLKIIAKTCNMVANEATWIGGDTHLYVDHLPMVEEQLKREPYKLCDININKELNSLEDILSLKYEDFELINYEYHPPIKLNISTGYKKS